MPDSITIRREHIVIGVTSYNESPLALKSCFMYFAVFPENHEIDAQRLFWLWIAEELIPAEEFTSTLHSTNKALIPPAIFLTYK